MCYWEILSQYVVGCPCSIGCSTLLPINVFWEKYVHTEMLSPFGLLYTEPCYVSYVHIRYEIHNTQVHKHTTCMTTTQHESQSLSKWHKHVAVSVRHLTRGPSQLLSPDWALVLQYGSGSPSDFLAKILDVDTPLFLFKTSFYFPFSPLLLCKSSRRIIPSVHHHSSVGSMYAYGAGDPALVPKWADFLITRCSGCRGHQISFVF